MTVANPILNSPYEEPQKHYVDAVRRCRIINIYPGASVLNRPRQDYAARKWTPF